MMSSTATVDDTESLTPVCNCYCPSPQVNMPVQREMNPLNPLLLIVIVVLLVKLIKGDSK